jgi:uncharacterized protein (DUF849 family)
MTVSMYKSDKRALLARPLPVVGETVLVFANNISAGTAYTDHTPIRATVKSWHMDPDALSVHGPTFHLEVDPHDIQFLSEWEYNHMIQAGHLTRTHIGIFTTYPELQARAEYLTHGDRRAENLAML